MSRFEGSCLNNAHAEPVGAVAGSGDLGLSTPKIKVLRWSPFLEELRGMSTVPTYFQDIV